MAGTSAEQADEMLLMGLRLTEGIDLARLAAIGGASKKASLRNSEDSPLRAAELRLILPVPMPASPSRSARALHEHNE